MENRIQLHTRNNIQVTLTYLVIVTLTTTIIETQHLSISIYRKKSCNSQTTMVHKTLFHHHDIRIPTLPPTQYKSLNIILQHCQKTHHPSTTNDVPRNCWDWNVIIKQAYQHIVSHPLLLLDPTSIIKFNIHALTTYSASFIFVCSLKIRDGKETPYQEILFMQDYVQVVD